jgi:hypothetical protein
VPSGGSEVPSDAISLITVLGNWGAFGILAAVFIWKDIRADAARIKADSDAQMLRIKLEEQQITYNRERLEADKSLAAALAALTGAIQSRNAK